MTDRRVFSDETRARLRIMEETTDGFRIAEEDLKIRGPGELFGTRQSGLPELKMANLVEDRELMEDARAAAFGIIRQDPQMRDPRHAGMVKKFKAQYLEKLELAHVS
jgi:ATP-dependent DNA helicase RecG